MHRTRTIDYAVVNHAWVNRGSELCRIAFVLIDAKEP